MKTRRLPLVVILLLCLLALAGPVRAALLAWETPLTGSVSPAELNLDSQGKVWASNGDTGEIWAVDTASGAYTIYPVGGSPSDAHSDGNGTVWWADSNTNQLGRLTTSNNMTTTWEIPGSLGLWGIALDQSGQVWASDGSDPYLYKFVPTANVLAQCTYTLPDLGEGEYLATEQGRIWLGDSINGRIVRLDGATLTWWNLPKLPNVSQPRDLAPDGSGRVWWTDLGKGYVGRLNPGANSITTFTPPITGTPQMLTLLDGKVWYTQKDPGQVVRLDPAAASGITTTVSFVSTPITPSCGTTLQPQAAVHITPSSGQASWNVTTYLTENDQPGWMINNMPIGSNPYGIAAAKQVWLVDNGRQMLIKVSPASSIIYLPLIRRS